MGGAVSDAHLGGGEALDCAVLAELPVGKVASAEPALPIVIRSDLIHEDGPVLAAMPRQIPLTIAVDVEPPHHTPALNRCLPDRGVDRLALPRYVARQTHIDRKQACHHFLLPCR